MKRVGLLGGSFNPAHRGHRRITLGAIRALDLDEAWWLVSPGNPLKIEATDMAPLEARLASARRLASRAPIRATAIETRLRTRYTADTVRALRRHYPRTRFIWLMGSDNLAQLHRWRNWRGLARDVAIAVVARPGYDGGDRSGQAMGWLRRFVRPARLAGGWDQWSLPAVVMLRQYPDPTSATAIRAADPHWYRREAADRPTQK